MQTREEGGEDEVRACSFQQEDWVTWSHGPSTHPDPRPQIRRSWVIPEVRVPLVSTRGQTVERNVLHH